LANRQPPCSMSCHSRATIDNPSNVHQHASSTKIGSESETPRIRDNNMILPCNFALKSVWRYENALVTTTYETEAHLAENRLNTQTIQQFDGEQAEKQVTRYVCHRVGGSEHRCELRRAEQHEGSLRNGTEGVAWRETRLRNHRARRKSVRSEAW